MSAKEEKTKNQEIEKDTTISWELDKNRFDSLMNELFFKTLKKQADYIYLDEAKHLFREFIKNDADFKRFCLEALHKAFRQWNEEQINNVIKYMKIVEKKGGVEKTNVSL